MGFADDFLLDNGDGGEVHFDAEIAAGDEEGIRGGDDGIEIFDRFGHFDFRDDVDLGVARFEVLAKLNDIVGGADEGEGDVIEFLFDGEIDILPVFFGDRGKLDLGAGEIEAFIGGEHRAVRDLAFDAVGGFFGNDHADGAVVDEDALADFEIIDETGIVGGEFELVGAAGGLSSDGFTVNGDDIAGGEEHGIVFDLSDADFRAAEVSHDGDGAVGAGADHLDVGGFLFEGAVGEVEECEGDAGIDEFGEDFGGGTGGAEGDDDFCFRSFHKWGIMAGGGADW